MRLGVNENLRVDCTWELAVIKAITLLIVERQQRVRTVGTADINLKCSCERKSNQKEQSTRK